MQINSITPVKFQASMSTATKNYLFNEAREMGKETCNKYFTQAEKFKDWGLDTSSITILETKTRDGIIRKLGLINSYLAPFKQILLPDKGTILDSFLSLKERDITNAEHSLKI